MPRRRRLHVASPQPPARHGEPAQVFRANAAAPDGRPGMDGVICGCGIHAGAVKCCGLLQGPRGCRKRLSRAPSRPRSAAAIPASRRSQGAGIGRAPASSDPRTTRRGHGRHPRRRQRVAGPRLQRQGSRSAGDPHRSRSGSRWSPNCAATSGRLPRSWASGRHTTRCAR